MIIGYRDGCWLDGFFVSFFNLVGFLEIVLLLIDEENELCVVCL